MSEREEIQGSVGREFPASEMQAAMGAIARGQRFVDALEGDDPDNVITWGEAKYAILQLIGDLQHEQAEHEKTRDLLKLVERGSDRTITQQRNALMELRQILAEHHDIEDGGAEGEHPFQKPNWAMRATNLIDEALAGPSPNPSPERG